MIAKRLRVIVFLTLLTASALQPATALIVNVDQFEVTRNGSQIFTDTFSDGNEPPSAPNNADGSPASYSVFGTFASNAEAQGQLQLDPNDGNVLPINSQFGITTLSAASNSFLQVSDAFSISAIFDLVINGGPLYSGYGIFLDDAINADRRNEVGLEIWYSTGLGADIVGFYYNDHEGGIEEIASPQARNDRM